MTKNTGPLVSLIEYRDQSHHKTYYENDFGVIQDNKIRFHEPDTTLNIINVASLSLVTYKRSNAHISLLCGLAAGVLFSLDPLCPWWVQCLACIASFLIASIFINLKGISLLVVMCNADQINIPIKKQQKKDVTMFINKFQAFRRFYSDIE